MKFVCYFEWDQLPDSATALFEQAEKDSIFLSRSWFASVATATLEHDQMMVLACVEAGNKVMAILPLKKSIGKTWYSIKHPYTSLYSLLLADDDRQQVIACLAQGLNQLPFSGLLLEPVDDNDSKLIGLQDAMEMAGFSCSHAFRHYNWIYRVQGQSYEDYMAARPSRLRNTISRKMRKLERDHGYEIRLFTGDEVPRAMSDYYAVYSASWKTNEQNVSFIDSIVDSFSKAGWTRLAILYIKGQPAASQLWFVHHDKANIFRLSYDERWKQYSPGSILTRFLMEHVIDIDNVEEIDFLTGNETYKRDWMSDRRERSVLCCVKNVKPAGNYERFVESLKRMLLKR